MSRERSRTGRLPDDEPRDDAFEDERLLQGYLARLMTLQDERRTWLEEADLQDAARDLGLSDADLQQIDAAVEAHRARGRKFLERRLWDEATEEFKRAAALRPFDAGLHHNLAEAHLGRWRATGDAEAHAAAERYAHRTLELDTEHAGAYKILEALKQPRTTSGGPSQAEVQLSKMLLAGLLVILALGAVLLVLFLFF